MHADKTLKMAVLCKTTNELGNMESSFRSRASRVDLDQPYIWSEWAVGFIFSFKFYRFHRLLMPTKKTA